MTGSGLKWALAPSPLSQFITDTVCGDSKTKIAGTDTLYNYISILSLHDQGTV